MRGATGRRAAQGMRGSEGVVTDTTLCDLPRSIVWWVILPIPSLLSTEYQSYFLNLKSNERDFFVLIYFEQGCFRHSATLTIRRV